MILETLSFFTLGRFKIALIILPLLFIQHSGKEKRIWVTTQTLRDILIHSITSVQCNDGQTGQLTPIRDLFLLNFEGPKSTPYKSYLKPSLQGEPFKKNHQFSDSSTLMSNNKTVSVLGESMYRRVSKNKSYLRLFYTQLEVFGNSMTNTGNVKSYILTMLANHIN